MLDVDYNFILKQHTKEKKSSNIRSFEKLIKMLDVDHNFILKHHTKEKRLSKSNELSKFNHFYNRLSEKLIKMLDVDYKFFLKHYSLIQHQVQTCENRVFAAELYAMTYEFNFVYEFNLEVVIKTKLFVALKIIIDTNRINLNTTK